MTKQEQIDRKVLSIRILLLLESYSYPERPLIWTAKVFGDLLSEDHVECKDVIGWMVKKGYVNTHNNSYFITTDGFKLMDDAKKKPVVAGDTGEFKEEALTGIVEKSTKMGWQISEISKIEKGVLPSSSAGPPMTLTTPKDIMENKRAALRTLAGTLGVSMDELTEHYDAGELRYCPGDHLGIFDGKNVLCNLCLKGANR